MEFMTKSINIFVLTTEYHFLLITAIIHDRYSSSDVRNILIFTGERLSGVMVNRLPANFEIFKIDFDREDNLKATLNCIILLPALKNLFVFTAYRDLETYLLNSVDSSVNRHLVQDGANFYFNILKPVFLIRIKETLKIYRNLWRKGIFFKKFVLYKKHLAQCGFIDQVWVTNPEVYEAPKYSIKTPTNIKLLPDEKSVEMCCQYFGLDKTQRYDNTIIYLSSRFTKQNEIVCEISEIQKIIAKLGYYKVLVKLHPHAPAIQIELFMAAFKDCVVSNFIPAELYIARAVDSLIIGTASAALYYHHDSNEYFSLINIYKRLRIFPEWIAVKFPNHVNVIKNIDELRPLVKQTTHKS
jgi:hypothetical protein